MNTWCFTEVTGTPYACIQMNTPMSNLLVAKYPWTSVTVVVLCSSQHIVMKIQQVT